MEHSDDNSRNAPMSPVPAMSPPSKPPGLEGLPPPGLQSTTGGVESAIRDALSAAADATVEEKASNLWRAAEAHLCKFERQQAKVTGRVEEDLKRCMAKTEALEESNEVTKRVIAALQEQLQATQAMLGLVPPGRLPAPLSVMGNPGVAMQAAPVSEIKYPPLPDFPFASDFLTGGDRAIQGSEATPHFGATSQFGSDQASPDAKQASMVPVPVPGLSGPTAPITLSDLLQSPPKQQQPQQPQQPCPAALPVAPKPQEGVDVKGDIDVIGLPPGLESPQPTHKKAPLQLSPQQRPAATPQRARDLTPQPRTPQRLPRTPMHPKSPAVPPSPFVICEGGGCVFGFTLRRAEGVEVGLKVAHCDGDEALLINSIVPGGAIDAWNRQCVGGPAAGKALTGGDRIVSVNSATNPEAMLAECRLKQILRFTVVRGNPDDIKCDVEGLWSGTERLNGRPQRGHPSSRTEASPDVAAATLASPRPSQTAAVSAGGTPVPSPGLRATAQEFVPAGQSS